jgi:hypothetical protein
MKHRRQEGEHTSRIYVELERKYDTIIIDAGDGNEYRIRKAKRAAGGIEVSIQDGDSEMAVLPCVANAVEVRGIGDL